MHGGRGQNILVKEGEIQKEHTAEVGSKEILA